VCPRFLLEGLNVQFYFGGTSLLIVVGVAMDTVNQVERSSSCAIMKDSLRGRPYSGPAEHFLSRNW